MDRVLHVPLSDPEHGGWAAQSGHAHLRPPAKTHGVKSRARANSMTSVTAVANEPFTATSADLEYGSQDYDSSEWHDTLLALLAEVHVDKVEVRRTGDKPIDGGAFGDVWSGFHLPSMQAVAIKVPRNGSNVVKLCRSLRRELGAWSLLHHRNVLLLLGVAFSPNRREMWLVSPWMRNKNLRGYLQDHPEADALQMLMGVGRGLTYVHSRRIVHGDLKANNVLVDDEGEAKLMDFGLSYDLEEPGMQTTSSMFHGNVRWLAPERLVPESFGLTASQSRSTASDVYALGMVVYEVFSGQIPFYETGNAMALVQVVLAGRRPAYPFNMTRPGLTARLWSFVGSCWHQDRMMRPISNALEPFLLDADSEVGDFRRMTARALRAEANLEDVKRQLENALEELRSAKEEKTKLRTKVKEGDRAHKQLASSSDREGKHRQELAESNANLKRVREELEAKNQELEACRIAIANVKKEKSAELAPDPSFDRPADYYVDIVRNLNTSIVRFSDQLETLTKVKGGFVKGTICSVLYHKVLESFFFGLDEARKAFIRQAQKSVEGSARHHWQLITMRTLKTSPKLYEAELRSAKEKIIKRILNDLGKETCAAMLPNASHQSLRELLDQILQSCVALSHDLICDCTEYRVVYFGKLAAFDAKCMALSSGSEAHASVLRTEQLGFQTYRATVHLKATVACATNSVLMNLP
ncbi:kinase-like protein [Calocera viscosa TUFC12733]|uniref:Kinase-like protein n=1 Tax=Calocera viscosa (strain TUFC12733) TaxID=1330018 RepID=A0A167P4I7_CALVF|nr:kinase-like protein [Calocera viscosa TUFC12733]